MTGPNAARSALYAALGDYLDRDRTDGIFALRMLGPGSVPGLTDLAPPEYHLDLLPKMPTDAQRAAITALGYRWEGPRTALHPDGHRLVLADYTTGETLDHVALRDWLTQDERARARYRAAFVSEGQRAAEAALLPEAQDWVMERVGFGPVQQALAALAGVPGPLMVSSGWALDLFLGKSTRLHDDLDVVLPRDRQMDVREVLLAQGWRLDACVKGAYQVWDGPLSPGAHQVHARHPDFGAHMLDLLFTDLDTETWRYRRNPSITRPLDLARHFTLDGTPYLAPELVLLFKAGAGARPPRGKDEGDFTRVAPQLDSQARGWLAGVLDPAHPWQASLAPTSPAAPAAES